MSKIYFNRKNLIETILKPLQNYLALIFGIIYSLSTVILLLMSVHKLRCDIFILCT